MDTITWDIETDVLVIGAGACGLAAAIAASAEGADVAVLEKHDRLDLSNTALSTGSVPGAGTRFQRAVGITDSPSMFLDDLLRQSGSHDAEDLARQLSLISAELVEWLVDEVGVTLELITDYRHVGHSVPRLHAPPSRRGIDLLQDLIAGARSRHIPIATSSPVDNLVVHDEVVLGATVAGGRSGSQRIGARKVILATNGHAANPSLVARFCPDMAEAPYFGGSGSAGEALLWGVALGAQLANIGAYQGYATLLYPEGSLLSWTTVEMGGVIVNRSGSRYGNEAVGYSGFASEVLRQGRPSYAVFDARIRDYVAAHELEFRELVGRRALGETANVSALAAAWKVNRRVLEDTFSRYGDAASGKATDEFGRTAFGMAPLEPPYVWTQVQAGLFHTQGGLRIDSEGRVMGPHRPIRNLFAGGGAAAGISGRSGGYGYSSGSGLLTALGIGQLAGRAAANEVKRETAAVQ